jgi:hypothetical protein
MSGYALGLYTASEVHPEDPDTTVRMGAGPGSGSAPATSSAPRLDSRSGRVAPGRRRASIELQAGCPKPTFSATATAAALPWGPGPSRTRVRNQRRTISAVAWFCDGSFMVIRGAGATPSPT